MLETNQDTGSAKNLPELHSRIVNESKPTKRETRTQRMTMLLQSGCELVGVKDFLERVSLSIKT